jgi:glycosyltransferase involved in cell wall biosynthesis
MSARSAAVRRASTAPADATHWHIVTGEYPPQPGGVSDYTRLIACALAAEGDRVDVWAPPCAAVDHPDPGVSVNRLPDHFGPRSLQYLGRRLEGWPGPRRLLIQYVPHAFGWKGANLPFCLWLRSRRADSVWVMFHEVAYPVGREYGVKENALGTVTRWMAGVVGRAAEQIFVSIPAWTSVVESLARSQAPIDWLPIPSTIPCVDDPAAAATVRATYAKGRPLVGHLGTYGRLINPMLKAALPDLLATTDCAVLLLGRQGEASRDAFVRDHPHFADRVAATGPLPDADLSRHVGACDVMIQPYPDGITTRRTSVMVALSHGRPVVTTSGWLSESFWRGSGAVLLAPCEDPAALAEATARLLSDRRSLFDLSARARAVYARQFDLSHTIERLRSSGASPTSVAR